MMNKKIVCSFVFLLFISSSLISQETVYGKVSLFDAIAVQNARITVKKSNLTVKTDSLGFFAIQCKVKDKISISAEGFDRKTIKIKNLKDSIHVDLKIASDESDIEVAASQGHINKNEISFAVKLFNTKPEYSLGFTNTIELVLGKYPRIELVGNEFILRGINTTDPDGKNGALIVINGILSSIESLKSIAVTDVKNVEILTGYSASAFGPGSGNGVISVTLKSY